MKKIILAVFALLFSLSSFAQIKGATLSASGLTCSMCSKAIYKALGKVSSVKSVDADIEGSKYHITFKEGSPVVLDDLKKAVENAGFSVAALQVTAHFPPVAIANDTHIDYGGSTYHFLNVSNQTISGDKTFTIVDKKFLPDADYRRYAKMTTMKCIETGRMAACCTKGSTAGTRVYHVTL
jgi:copper chaperone CopZ